MTSLSRDCNAPGHSENDWKLMQACAQVSLAEQGPLSGRIADCQIALFRRSFSKRVSCGRAMFASHTRLSWLFQIQFDSSGRHAACLQVESKFGFYVASHLLLISDCGLLDCCSLLQHIV